MRGFLFAAGCAAVVACSQATAGQPDGTATLSWRGAYAGQLEASAAATWCPADSMLQIVAVREDTAFGLALFATDTIRPAEYPILSPQIVVDWRPLASAGLRWLSETEVVGFEAIRGVVSVTAVDSTGVSGTFDLGFRLPAGSDTLKAAGTFDRLRVTPAVGSCGRVTKAKGG